jgi:hypothetical protein
MSPVLAALTAGKKPSMIISTNVHASPLIMAI